jgi:hypothetical protein
MVSYALLAFYGGFKGVITVNVREPFVKLLERNRNGSTALPLLNFALGRFVARTLPNLMSFYRVQ